MKQQNIVDLLKKELPLFLGISSGLFLFILFFQPFALDKFEMNNLLLFEVGMGCIVFFYMFLIRNILISYVQNYSETNTSAIIPYSVGSFLILILSAVSLTFYLRYVGQVNISFYVVFKILLICLIPPIVLVLNDSYNVLKNQNYSLIEQKKLLQIQIHDFQEDFLNKKIEFISEYASENLTLQVGQIAIIKSANNYVEIVFKEDDEFRRKLIRNTLKNIEQQLSVYQFFIRCHRICIVNTQFIEKLNKHYGSYWLTLKGCNEKIPVSRQYLLKVKENI